MLTDFWVFSSNDNVSIHDNGAIMFINLLMSIYCKYTEIQLNLVFNCILKTVFLQFSLVVLIYVL